MSIHVPRTFLELVQRTRQECQIPGNGPATVAVDTGTHGRLVGWVSYAWMDLQAFHPNWRFMRKETTWTLDAGDRSKTPVEIVGSDTLRDWIREDFRVYATSGGVAQERLLSYVPYNAFRTQYELGTHRDTQGQPNTITITPDNSIMVYPTPDEQYTFVGEYQRSAQEMTEDDDEPDIPVEFRMILVFSAMTHYGRYEAANEVYQDAHFRYNRILRQLEASQLPQPQLAGAGGLG